MIEDWLNRLHSAWQSHDIDAVLGLFADDVEYWETPHKRLLGKAAVRKEWQAIFNQKDIVVSYELFNSSPNNRHAAVWHLSYTKNGTRHSSSGVYLIALNDAGLCTYFYYTGENID